MQIKGKAQHVSEISRNANIDYAEIVVGGDLFGANVKSIHVSEIIANQMRDSGVKLIAAESFGRAFYRNCVNSGLPIIECKGIDAQVKDGETLEVDLAAGTIKNADSGKELRFAPIAPVVMDLLEQGGIIKFTKAQLAT